MRRTALGLVLLLAHGIACGPSEPPLDLVLLDGKLWTGNPQNPWATWVAIRGERIAAVGSGAPPAAQRTLDMAGRLVVPGFNDTHVHFASAGHLLLGANLLDVHDDDSFVRRIREAVERLPEGSWITHGDWGAYEAWGLGSEGKASGNVAYAPRRALIDALTARHPVLVTRYDRKVGLANAVALRLLGVESDTGLLEGEGLEAALAAIPAKSGERRLAEARRALLECRRWGVTSVQDMSPLDQVDLYEELRRAGLLTVRVHFSPARLSDVEGMIERGWTVGAGDAWLRFGTVKAHIDGIMGNRTARFFEPYADNEAAQAEWRGGWREFSADLGDFRARLIAADAAGIQLRVHAIGDEANAILLDLVDELQARNGERDRRFRLVHAQVLRSQDFARLAGKGIVAEVQPYHCTDDMRWMEERIGHERSRGAYAFRSLQGAGCTLAFGSDWPGTNASYYPVNPILGLYAAVTRQTVEGTPPGGWFPEERIGIEAALRAYTAAGAFASFEEGLKGTLEPGKLADLAVLDTDLFASEPARWLDAHVDYTIVGGAVVYDRAQAVDP